MIEIFDLFKSYDNEKTYTLKNINLKIKQGDMIAVTGKSGSGKTTLLNIIGCLDKATKGGYIFEGTNINKLSSNAMSEFRNNNIGFVFQEFHLVSYLTVLDNVMLPVFHLKKKQRSMFEKRIKALSEMMNISHILNRLTDKLSGGEKQRVAILRALIKSPKIIIADEPTGNLDDESTASILNELLRINKDENVTVIIATHDEKLYKSCDRVFKIENGLLSEINNS